MNQVMHVETVEPPPHHRLRAGRAALWALYGLLLGGVAPTAVALFLGEFGSFAIGSSLIGILVGALIGHQQPVARLSELPAAPRWGIALVGGPLLGLLWGGLAGLGGGAAVAVQGMLRPLLQGGFGAPAEGLMFVFIGLALGAIVGTVPVSLFVWLRLVLIRWPRLVWIAPTASLLLTPPASLVLFMPAIAIAFAVIESF